MGPELLRRGNHKWSLDGSSFQESLFGLVMLPLKKYDTKRKT